MINPHEYTLEELGKQLALLENHFKQFGTLGDEAFCLDCLYKHLLTIEGLAEEGMSFTNDEEEILAFAKMAQMAREMRKAVQHALSESNSEREITAEFWTEKVKPKEYFDPHSFRILCPECPNARCALCPPELYGKAHRIVIGCKKGYFKEGICQIGTEVHVIYHPHPPE